MSDAESPAGKADSRPEARTEVAAERYVGAKDLTRWDSRLGRAVAAAEHRLSGLLGAHGALILILAIGAAIAAGATVAVAGIYDAVTEVDGVAGLDRPMLHAAMNVRSPWLDTAATYYTDIGGVIVMPILASLAIVALVIQRREWTPLLVIGGAGVGSLLMTVAGKGLVGRARPKLADAVPPFEHSPSFPSGHTLNATAIAGAIAYVLVLRQARRATRALTVAVAVVFAFTIGLSRIYLGHHWFTDVLVAWMLGLGWLAVVITAHRLYLTSRKKQIQTGEAR
ncbi:MAG: hypothetical protein JWR33_94 [Naasia sp.]|jgi:membrane-associated phospholipid phosphatase|uniref:phosphatase PAP2 family protein n=1 Tax=Naasia sp. TaxID=2546198 RepID=UPI002612BB7D|nr:phosphatase PAP2 family protein [Naasia sp.]MCU1569353.1 hypothetical protein [Naasia sp.]